MSEDDKLKWAVAAMMQLEQKAINAAVRESEKSQAESEAPGEVDHPRHYNSHPSGIECIDVVEHMGFCVGSAIKYLWRAGHKPGAAALTDLGKARWYIEREMKRLVAGGEEKR